MSVQELEAEVARLSAAEIKAFAQWFEEFRADAWGRQIEAGVAAGKLDKLAQKADEELGGGKKRRLQLKAFALGMKTPLPTKSELATEMFD